MPLQLQTLEPRLALDGAAASEAFEAVVALADTIAPQVRSVTPPAPKTYAAGRTLSFTVKFSEPVVASGLPTLPIGIGETVRQAAWNGNGNGKKSLTFTTVVQPGDLAPTGVQIAGPIGLMDGATIRDKAGNALIPTASGTFPKARVDAVGPRVNEFGEVTVTRKLVSLRVTFDEAVRVTGKPSIPFTLAGVQKQLRYSSGSGRNVLTFQYKATKRAVLTSDDVAVSSPEIVLGSGRITDKASNVATSLTSPGVPSQDTWMQFVTVGDARNAADETGFGAVDHTYGIGKYEVTIGQYTEFLNAVAATDTYGLYADSMGTQLLVAGISRSGLPGAYTYSVIENGGSTANRPITYVSWYDAARFANWMHNGRPTGPQGPGTTESGAYTLNGATRGAAPTKNAGARFYIPTENEWYKAAYYKGGGVASGYWAFATQSDAPPDNRMGDWPNQANNLTDVYAATRSPVLLAGHNHLTDVGAFVNSASPYGTFDQTGNVFEWNDRTGADIWARCFRGGAWDIDDYTVLSSSVRYDDQLPAHESALLGFRLARVV